MSKYSKINFIYFLQKWMDSVPGQTFLNYAYSWGAAVVILGTLFKLTHLPGANFMLFLGMGTEVVVFFISAFDRPFDKTTIDMELDNHMADQVIDSVAASPLGEAVIQPSVAQSSVAHSAPTHSTVVGSAVSQPVVSGGNVGGTVGNAGGSVGNVGGVAGTSTPSGTVIIGGAGSAEAGSVGGSTEGSNNNGNVSNGGSINFGNTLPSGGTIIIGGGGSQGRSTQGTSEQRTNDQTATPESASENKASQVAEFTSSALQQSASASIITPAPAVSQETAAEMEVVTKAYIERLAELNEMLEKVGQLTSRLSTDSEEMENLNRTLTGIARVYEMQLKSASQQITTQDSINEQTRIMAQKIQELNSIYTRMIEAMTVNMPGGMQNNS